MPRHCVRNALSTRPLEDRRVCDADDVPPAQVRILPLDLVDFRGHLRRVDLYADVRPLAAVVFADAVDLSIRIRRVPAHREGPRITEVKPPPDPPGRRNLERLYDVCPEAVLVVRRIVAPLPEYLPLEAVPAPVEQRLFLRLRLHGEVCQIIRVVAEQLFVVKDRRRHKDAAAPHFDLLPVRLLDLPLLPDRRHRRRRRDKSLLHPCMADPARV